MSLFCRSLQVQQYYARQRVSQSQFYSASLQREYSRGISRRTGSARMFCSAPQGGRSRYLNTKVAQSALILFAGFGISCLVTSSLIDANSKPFDPEKEMRTYLMTKRPENDEYFDALIEDVIRSEKRILELLEFKSVAARRLHMIGRCDQFLERDYEDVVDVMHILERTVVDVAYVTNNDENYIAEVRLASLRSNLYEVQLWNIGDRTEKHRLDRLYNSVIPSLLMCYSRRNGVSVEIFVKRKTIYDDLVRVARETRPELLSSNQAFTEDLRKLAIKLSEMHSSYNAQEQIEMLVDL
eukprot:924226_1